MDERSCVFEPGFVGFGRVQAELELLLLPLRLLRLLSLSRLRLLLALAFSVVLGLLAWAFSSNAFSDVGKADSLDDAGWALGKGLPVDPPVNGVLVVGQKGSV